MNGADIVPMNGTEIVPVNGAEIVPTKMSSVNIVPHMARLCVG